MTMTKKAKVIIFGMDGATFDVARPLMENGEMPALKAIIDTGCSGPLESTTPWQSAVAWTSCTTGLNPGKHGVFNFFTMGGDFTEKPVSSGDICGDKIWHILNRNGYKTGVFNVPLTFPVEHVDGFMVSGLPRSCVEIFPPKLAPLLETCRRCAGISASDNGEYITNKLAIFQQRMNQEVARIKLAAQLSETAPDFFMGVFTITDELQHSFWYAHDTSHPAHNLCDEEWEPQVVNLAYKMADVNLKVVIDAYAGPETTVIVVSDHGFGPAKHAFFPNRLLRDWGYLVTGDDGAETEPPDADKMFVPRRLRFGLQKTRVFMGPALSNSFVEIFVNRIGRTEYGTVPGEEYENLIAEVAEKFESWTDPATGLKPVTKAHRPADMFSGPRATAAPDLLLECDEFNCFSETAGAGPIEDIIPWRLATNGQLGIHTRYVIFAARGPGIRRGRRVEGLRIIDVAPTALHLFGLAGPANMDGRVMKNIFTEEHIENNPVECQRDDSSGAGAKSDESKEQPGQLRDEDRDAIADTLKGLGYFS